MLPLIGSFWQYAYYLSVQHFSYFLADRDFHVFTDHQPLTFAMKRDFGNMS